MLVTGDDFALFTDGRYRTQAGAQLATAGVAAHVEIGDTVTRQRAALANRVSSGGRVGLEAHAVTWAQQRDLASVLAPSEVVPTTGIVEELRAVKDEGEVARIRAACRDRRRRPRRGRAHAGRSA